MRRLLRGGKGRLYYCQLSKQSDFSVLTGRNAPLLASALSNGSASLNVARLNTASLHLLSTVAEITLAVLHECGALRDFMAGIMAWVGENAAGHEGRCDCESAEEVHSLN